MADGLTYHPDTSNVQPRVLTLVADPAHEVQFCCPTPTSVSGTTEIEINNSSVHVCLNCNTGYTSEIGLVNEHRVENFDYSDPIGHKVQSFRVDEALTYEEYEELKRLLRIHPRRKHAMVKLVFLRRRLVVSEMFDAA
jgi:hypothetical protein